MKLLLVEDETSIATPLVRVLKKKGFDVEWQNDGEKGYLAASANAYSCIVLDLNLPSMDGIEICTKLRELNITTPILMLTARTQVYDTLKGFKVGADDYVVKPFELSILIARINALILRNSNNKSKDLFFNKCRLNIQENQLEENENKVIQLSKKEMGILEYLVRNKGRVVSSEELLQNIWDSEVDLFTETIKTHIKTLRQKVDPNKTLILTIIGKGYVIH